MIYSNENMAEALKGTATDGFKKDFIEQARGFLFYSDKIVVIDQPVSEYDGNTIPVESLVISYETKVKEANQYIPLLCLNFRNQLIDKHPDCDKSLIALLSLDSIPFDDGNFKHSVEYCIL